MTIADRYAQWDAAYVLGALAPAERREYEEHVAGCRACQAAVAELAGMPGLLAQVPAAEVLAMDLLGEDGELAPPALGPAVGSAVHQRRRWPVPVAAAAAALVIGGIGGYAVSTASRDDPPPVTAVSSSGRLAFSAVEPSSMTAVLDVITVANGTELRVECQYAGESSPVGGADYQASRADYAIWVVGREGTQTQVKSWTARPDQVMHPSGMSTLPVGQIAAVEIRRVDDGRTVMRADLA